MTRVESQMSRGLLCTVIGDKYERMYRPFRRQFEAYAAKCGAEPVVIREPLDRERRHGLFTQRLLIPAMFKRFDEIAHLDIDMLIPRNAGNIFSSMPAAKAFGAALSPRGTPAYKEAWDHAPFTTQTHAEYFESKELRSGNPLFQINGGALVFRTIQTADLFASWYFDAERYAGKTEYYYSNEEYPMAFLSQDRGIFYELAPCYNRQLIYALCENEEGLRARREVRAFSNRARRRIGRALGMQQIGRLGMRRYVDCVEELLRAGNMVHFSASYPIPRVNSELLVG
jgi:hypothetical protein